MSIFEPKPHKIGKKMVGFSKNSFDHPRGDMDLKPFRGARYGIRAACASKTGIVGEVYSELQGLQVWVVG